MLRISSWGSLLLFMSAGFLSAAVNAQSYSDKICNEKFSSCNIKSLDDIWRLWGQSNAIGRTLTLDKFYSNSSELHYQLLSCNEVEQACREARKPDLAPYRLQGNTQPEIGWQVLMPEKVGLKARRLQQAITNADHIPRLHSLLVVKDGGLVVEEYFDRQQDNRPHHIQSITKSITSLLLGIAVDRGYITSEQEKIKAYFSGYFSSNPDQRKQNITIKQLLTMQSGLNFVDNKTWSPYSDSKSWTPPGSFKRYWYVKDHASEALKYQLLPPSDKPVILYSTPACNLLTTIISRSSNMTAKQFADKYLFSLLGIKNYFWYRDIAGNYLGGHTLFLRPRALATLGQMLVDGGVYNDQRIVSKEWIDKSFAVANEDFVEMPAAQQTVDYGYLWYTGEYKRNKYYFAWGFGGQFLMLVPDKKLVIVTTANPDVNGVTHWEKSQNIFKQVLLKVLDAL